ncbi:MAG: ABC transporter permease [Dongiaceae bacterium]
MRLEPRSEAARSTWIAAPLAAIVASFVIAAILVLLGGASPFSVFAAVIKGALGTQFAFLETLTRATPLIFTGLAAAVAFRAKLWNIGGEAQLYAGAIVTIVLGTGALPLPAPILIPLILAAGMLAGALLLLGPTLLKTRFGVDEVVTTLLLNFVMVLFVSMLLDGALKDPMGLGWPQSQKVIEAARLPKLVQGKRLHLGFVIAIGAALIVWFINAHDLGYEMRAVGFNPRAARFAGIPVNWVMAKTALLGRLLPWRASAKWRGSRATSP